MTQHRKKNAKGERNQRLLDRSQQRKQLAKQNIQPKLTKSIDETTRTKRRMAFVCSVVLCPNNGCLHSAFTLFFLLVSVAPFVCSVVMCPNNRGLRSAFAFPP